MFLRGKIFTTLLLVFCIVALSGNLTAQGQARKGVKIEVETTEGQKINGELISVKRDSLLLMDAETQADLSVKIADVKAIMVNNKSRILELGVLGALIGASAQGLVQQSDTKTTHGVGGDDDPIITQSKTGYLLYGAIAGGVGMLIGAAVGMNKIIQIEGRSDADVQQDLEKLSKKARVKGIQ